MKSKYNTIHTKYRGYTISIVQHNEMYTLQQLAYWRGDGDMTIIEYHNFQSLLKAMTKAKKEIDDLVAIARRARREVPEDILNDNRIMESF